MAIHDSSIGVLKQHLSLMLVNKVSEALRIIEKARRKTRVPLIVNFSGGKDSVVTIDLVSRVTREFKAFFMESSIDFPETLDFVRRQAEILGVELLTSNPKRDYLGDFYDFVERYGYFPNFKAPWCSSRLKHRPSKRVLQRLFGEEMVYRLTGIRRFESTRRTRVYHPAEFFQSDCENSRARLVHPLLLWTDEDVAEYIAEKRLEVHSGYKVCGVSGCFWCIYYQRSIYERVLKMKPNLYEGIIRLEEKFGQPSCAGRLFLRDLKAEAE